MVNNDVMKKLLSKKPPAWVIDSSNVHFGKYHCIGEGSVSFVFKAKFNGRHVAVKMLKTEDDGTGSVSSLKQIAADFNEELKAVSMKLNHTNVEQFVGAGTTKYNNTTRPMIIYEYLGGGSLEDVYSDESERLGKAFKPAKTLGLSWCHQLLSALNYLHTREVPFAHRDIKPANCLLTDDRKVLKLADFSLATPLHGNCADLSGAPSIAGSLRYMAPEVAEAATFDLAKADVYSAALTCFFIVYGERPFEGYDPRTAQTMAVEGIRPTVKSAELSKILSPAWEFSPRKRPSAERFAQGLSALRKQ